MSFRRWKAASLLGDSESTRSRYGVAPIGSPSLSSCKRAARSDSSLSSAASCLPRSTSRRVSARSVGRPGGAGQRVGALPQRKLARELAHRRQHHVERAAVRAQLVLVHVRQAAMQAQALGRIFRLLEHARPAPRPHDALRRRWRSAAPSTSAARRAHRGHVDQALQHRHGARALGVRRQRRDRAFERVAGRVELLQIQLRQLHVALGAHLTRGRVAMLRDDLRRAGGVAGRQQQPRQATTSARSSVAESSSMRRYSATAPSGRLEHGFFQRRPLAEQAQALFVAGRAGHAQLEQPAQVVAPIVATQDGFELAGGVGVRRIALEHLLVDLDGVVGARQLFRVDARQLQLEHAARGVTARAWPARRRRARP